MPLAQTELLAFALTTLVVLATPGITVSTLVGTTLNHGMRAGFAMELGANIARIGFNLALLFGLTAVTAMMSFAFVWIKLIGAAYLIWLGIKAIRTPPTLRATAEKGASLRALVMRGMFVVWTNPKAFIFLGAFLPQFVHPDRPVGPQLLVLAAIWMGIGLVTDTIYILLGGHMRRMFKGDNGRRMGWLSGAVLIGAGLWLALQQKA